MYKKIALTFVTEIVVLVCTLATLKIASVSFDDEEFALYQVCRRALSILCFTLLVGLGISIPKFIAKLEQATDAFAILLAGLFLTSITVTTMLIIVGLFQNKVALLFFGDPQANYIVGELMIMVIGFILHTVVYSYFRGLLRMELANGLQIINVGLVPPIAIVGAKGDLALAITATGIAWILSSLTVLFIIGHCSRCSLTQAGFTRNIVQLLNFGMPRIPGEFALFGIFAIPTFLVANMYGIEEAGRFSLSISLFQMATSIFSIAGIVLLPYVAKQQHQNCWSRIHKAVNRTLLVSLFMMVVGALFSYFYLDGIVTWYLGIGYVASSVAAKKLILGGILYILYIVLRNPLDAVVSWPYNSINLSFVLIGLSAAIGLGFEPTLSMNGGIVAIGILTYMSWIFASRKSIH